MKKSFMIICISFIAAFVLITGTNFFSRSDVSANNESVIRYEKVKVREGDTLWSIAKEHYQEPCGDIRDYVDQITECNALDSEDEITEGCYLCIPVYTKNVQ